MIKTEKPVLLGQLIIKKLSIANLRVKNKTIIYLTQNVLKIVILQNNHLSYVINCIHR